MLKTYLDQLHELAQDIELPLLKAFIKAGVPTSTYYRSIKGETQLTYDTAVKVANIISLIERKRKKRS